MLTYDVAGRRRQFDGRFAVWGLIPDPTLSQEERDTIKVSSFANAPKTMTPPLCWVNVAVYDTARDAYDAIPKLFIK